MIRVYLIDAVLWCSLISLTVLAVVLYVLERQR